MGKESRKRPGGNDKTEAHHVRRSAKKDCRRSAGAVGQSKEGGVGCDGQTW